MEKTHMKRHFGTAAASLLIIAGSGLTACERSPSNSNAATPASAPAPSQPVAVSRQHIGLQEYCSRAADILNNNPPGFAAFVQSYTPFRPGARITATFNSAVHGHAITMELPCDTFILIPNPKLNQWTLEDVGLQQTGGLVSSIHAGLGADYSKNDPEDIRRLARLAVHDISINSQYLSPLIDHLKNAHGVVLLNADGSDSAEFAAIKQQAILQLTP
jgi:hypothetical protein